MSLGARLPRIWRRLALLDRRFHDQPSSSGVEVLRSLAAHQAVHDRDEEKRVDGCDRKPADDRASSGAFCSPPSPSARLIGSMPISIASAVMRTGRSRVRPAISAEARASRLPNAGWRCSLANVTIRMLFEVATPIDMMHPISAGTLIVVSRDEQRPQDSRQCAGQGHQDDQRVGPGLEIHHHQEIDQQDREADSQSHLEERLVHALHLPADDNRAGFGNLPVVLGDDLVHLIGNRAEVRVLDVGGHVEDRLDVVVAQQ